MPKFHNKKKGDGIYVTVRSKGVRRGHKHQLAHVSKKWCIVETDVIFLYLATWNVPRMFRNMKHLWKNVTQERRYPQRGSGLRTHWPPFCAGLADSIGQVFTIGHLFFYTEFLGFRKKFLGVLKIPDFPRISKLQNVSNSGIPGMEFRNSGIPGIPYKKKSVRW